MVADGGNASLDGASCPVVVLVVGEGVVHRGDLAHLGRPPLLLLLVGALPVAVCLLLLARRAVEAAAAQRCVVACNLVDVAVGLLLGQLLFLYEVFTELFWLDLEFLAFDSSAFPRFISLERVRVLVLSAPFTSSRAKILRWVSSSRCW